MTELLHYEFIQHAIFAAILVSIACGIIGTYVVVNRIVFITGGISHIAFGGLGAAYYAGVNPLLGATAISILSALGLGWVNYHGEENEDAMIGILWAFGMAMGSICIALTSGYAPDLMSYLFGSILTVSTLDIFMMITWDIFILLIVGIFFKQFQSISYDREYARTRGIPVNLLYTLLLILIAITVVMLIQIMGTLLLIALITIPVTIANIFCTSIRKIMILSSFFCLIFSLSGLWLSYFFNLPSGAAIVVIACGAYAIMKGLRLKVNA
jgi:zinc transport system permease protein